MAIDERMARAVASFPSYQAARKAWDQGRDYFVPTIPAAAPGLGGLNGDTGIGLQLEAIEHIGWRLHTWQMAVVRGGQPEAYPLFVRPPS